MIRRNLPTGPQEPASAGVVALPSRAFGDDQAAAWPELPAAGQVGPVALPSREVGIQNYDDGGRVSQGASGPIRAGFTGPLDMFGGPAPVRTVAAPVGAIAAHYVRQFVSTGANALARMVEALPGPTNWTLNTNASASAPASPIPVFRRFVVRSLVEPWGWGRIYSDYYDPPEVQKSAQVRRMLAGGQLPRMRDPYWPALTRLATSPSANTPAPKLLQLGATAPSVPNPYATR